MTTRFLPIICPLADVSRMLFCLLKHQVQLSNEIIDDDGNEFEMSANGKITMIFSVQKFPLSLRYWRQQ